MSLKPDKKLVAEMSRLLRDNNLSELEYEKDGERIKVAAATSVPVAVPAHSAASVASTAASATSKDSTNDAAKDTPKDGTVGITSPMVGMVYLSPSPDAPPFVKVGEKVRKGKTIMLVEAMKTMNPVQATTAGVVEQIAVSNESPVEYGQLLATIKPS